MSYFIKQLEKYKNDPKSRTWVYIVYDQLNDNIGLLARSNPDAIGIILIENSWKPSLRPYHKQKLALIVCNMRHFALEQAERGVAVKYVFHHGPYREALEKLPDTFGKITVMRPAEYELRCDLQPLVVSGKLAVIPHEGWLTTRQDFLKSQKNKTGQWRMDAFYRYIRNRTGILMEDGKPTGGKYSHDADNRKPWHGDPPPAEPPEFQVDEIKQEVADLIENKFAGHPGKLNMKALPATNADAQKFWSWVIQACLPNFGPYEDAMSVKSTTIFHSRISSLMNIHRLLPNQVVEDTEKLSLPLSSKEGFVRQVLGWREFMFHVHDITDGFRKFDGKKQTVQDAPGDGSYQLWSGKAWFSEKPVDAHGGASPKLLGGDANLPVAYWGKKSGLNCLDHVVDSVWEEGFSHHITRLMVLANLGTLLDISPRQLTDWFWIAYTDAYDWVVEPNVLGMGMFSIGDLLSTKPYVSGAAYINKMSDYCKSCRFDPKKNCPITNLFWAFLRRHRKKLKDNQRLKMILSTAQKRDSTRQKIDADIFNYTRKNLSEGNELNPVDIQNLKQTSK